MPSTRPYHPMRALPQPAQAYKPGDVLVVFGELFSRGYANGIVDEAVNAGMKIIRSTVGRRDSSGRLRKLDDDELATQTQPFINIPLEAGFDMEPCEQDGSTPCDQLKNVKMSAWEQAKLDWAKVESSRSQGTLRFRASVEAYMKELGSHIPKGANVIFAHTMAGGVPRAKILMPTMNKVFKGVGDRHVPSEQFWNSDLGRLCAWNFEDVTAWTLSHLIELSADVRSRVEREGGNVSYVAYGYHGTEVMVRGEYAWQSYAPYVQGWAKIKLEDFAEAAAKRGVHVSVFNCPEILTNSSSIFQGVEIPLYPLLAALKREGGPSSAKANEIVAKALSLLKPEFNLDSIIKITDEVLSNPAIRAQSKFDGWPQHNSKDQMECLIGGSDRLFDMHKDPKNLITFLLSEEVFRATGYLMFHESRKPRAPVFWLGHDIISKALVSGKTL